VRRLASEGATALIAERSRLDLTDRASVDGWLAQAKPDAIFLAAAKVGGIHANRAYPADFIADNLGIAAQDAAARGPRGCVCGFPTTPWIAGGIGHFFDAANGAGGELKYGRVAPQYSVALTDASAIDSRVAAAAGAANKMRRRPAARTVR
jgi:hypothetical protein